MFRAAVKRGYGLSVVGRSFRKSVQGTVVRAVSVKCVGRQLFKPVGSGVVTESNYKILRYYSTDLPEHIKVMLPALSPTMEEGTLISWAKKEGDKLNEGDLLAEIETDKATMAFETPEEGYLAKILVGAGTKNVPIGKLVCIIVSDEKSVALFKDFKDDGGPVKKIPVPSPPVAAPGPPVTPAAQPPPVPTTPVESSHTDRIYASPMARRLAEQRNIRLQGKGTGLFDSITSSDLERIAAAGLAPAPAPLLTPVMTPPAPTYAPGAAYLDIPVSNIRGVIAKRLLESKHSIPHYYVTIELEADKIVALRARMNKKYEREGLKMSLNDFIIKAMALASVRVPEANSSWHTTYIRQYKNVDVSLAVSTERGLITPIVTEANVKGVGAISREVKALAAKARDGKLQPNEFQGGTIGLSNLGMFDVDVFSAIVNPPQSCILAVGRLNNKLVIDDTTEKGFKEVKTMSVTLSADHRVVDGAVAARWMQAFREYMEDPETMIL